MSYPLTNPVYSGQPTAASHYNNLRADAVFGGNSASDSVSYGVFFQMAQDNMNLVYLATNRLRVVASVAAPVAIKIEDYMLVANANVDLSGGPSGVASTWYIFAVRSAGSSTFTLVANTSITPGVNQRLIGLCYWDGSAVVRDSIVIERQAWVVNTLKGSMGIVCQGRITLNSGDPVPVATVTGGTVYFTPYLGNVISMYGAQGWYQLVFAETSISFAAVSGSKNVDVFGYDSGGALALEIIGWASDTARTTAIELYQGVYFKTGNYTRRYLGTVRTSAASTVTDSIIFRGVWNYYNRVTRNMYLREQTSHTYNGAARKWNNSDTNNVIEFVRGVAEDIYWIGIDAQIQAGSDGNNAIIYPWMDGTYYQSAEFRNYNAQSVNGLLIAFSVPAAGYHIVQTYETGNHAASTFTNMHHNSYQLG